MLIRQLIPLLNTMANRFTMVIDTTKAGSASDTFVLPTAGAGTYNYTVYWGDGTSNAVTVNTSQTHVYPAAGIYTVGIVGTFPRVFFNNAGDKLKLLQVTSLGSVAFTSFANAFQGCTNLTTFVAGLRANTVGNTSCSSMFNSCSTLVTADFSNFNTTAVTTMASMFSGCTTFNQSVSNFGTAACTNMTNMFQNCTVFNQSVSSFNTAAVTTMTGMFFNCSAFNQSVSNFNTAGVSSFAGGVFQNCTAFNQDISGWNIGLVTNMTNMLTNSGFNKTNYDLLLPAWQGQSHQNNVTFSAGSAHYSAGAPATARAALVTNGWTITDGGSP